MGDRSRPLIVPATVINSLLTLAPQLIALVTLEPSDFGKFSIVYLVFAWGASLQMSVVCEPVGREFPRVSSGSLDRDYPAVATYIAVVTGLLAGACAQLLWQESSVTAVLAFAAGTACFRVPARYADVLRGYWGRAITLDVLAFLLFVMGGSAAIALGRHSIDFVLWAWVAATVGSCVMGLSPELRSPAVVSRWLRRRRRDIAPLLLDSSVLNISAIGVPYAIAPILGLADFGVYRAISNVAAPVRLLIEPLRPSWARVDAVVMRHKMVRAAAVIGVPAGVAAGLALESIHLLPWELGVLDDLRPWAVPAGAFVTFNLISGMFHALARLHLGGRALWRGRVAQSSTAIVLPIGGALIGGLTGAIWCYVAATALGALAWTVLTRARLLRKV